MKLSPVAAGHAPAGIVEGAFFGCCFSFFSVRLGWVKRVSLAFNLGLISSDLAGTRWANVATATG